MRAKLYIAAPLFSMAEKRFNLWLAEQLVECFDVYLPQRDGGLFVDMLREGADQAESTEQIFTMDLQAIDASDMLLAILDGRAVDEGVAFEVEVRTVNHRHLDARIKLPRQLSEQEPDVRAQIQAALGRGKVDLSANPSAGASSGRRRNPYRR